MTKSVSKLIVVVVAIAAILSLSGLASAQYAPTDPVTPQAPQLPLPTIRGSSFEPDAATAATGFLGFASINPTVDGAAAAADGDIASGGTGGGLAITGVETNVALAVGVGLLALGGTAVIASRKRIEDE